MTEPAENTNAASACLLQRRFPRQGLQGQWATLRYVKRSYKDEGTNISPRSGDYTAAKGV